MPEEPTLEQKLAGFAQGELDAAWSTTERDKAASAVAAGNAYRTLVKKGNTPMVLKDPEVAAQFAALEEAQFTGMLLEDLGPKEAVAKIDPVRVQQLVLAARGNHGAYDTLKALLNGKVPRLDSIITTLNRGIGRALQNLAKSAPFRVASAGYNSVTDPEARAQLKLSALLQPAQELVAGGYQEITGRALYA